MPRGRGKLRGFQQLMGAGEAGVLFGAADSPPLATAPCRCLCLLVPNPQTGPPFRVHPSSGRCPLSPRELPPFMGKFTTRVYERALVPMDTRERHNQD
ncbi:unnamed protein product [Rangifer tarandus platyrhynchus]|uniref:Uncharacterized protein n=2 Tax=Rangifer tarandus platyrhynchus TaxID=3082113 RepID=A0ACB0E6C5_RANTA|nr:unnamed protein product [Rangifer tarandus platyrhynchus]CAI9696165.1 unnamed protein product [Rangifer tarandus platyrhynchus]